MSRKVWSEHRAAGTEGECPLALVSLAAHRLLGSQITIPHLHFIQLSVSKALSSESETQAVCKLRKASLHPLTPNSHFAVDLQNVNLLLVSWISNSNSPAPQSTQNITATSHRPWKSYVFPLQLTKASRIIHIIKRVRQHRLSRHYAESSLPFSWPTNWHELHFVIILVAQREGQGMEIKKVIDSLELKLHWKDSLYF